MGEIIEYLKQTKMVLVNKDAFDELVKKASANQSVQSADTISRQAAIDAIGEEPEVWSGNDEYAQGLNNQWHYDVNALKAAPSAQPEPKKGKWIEYDSDEDKYDVIKCSCCMHMFTVDSYHWTDIGFVKDDFNYCPNCGADMKRGDCE